jgi:hypothetical protein
VLSPLESTGACVSQHSWQSADAPASPGALTQLAVVPPLLELLPELDPLLLLVLPLLLLVLLLVDPLLELLLPLLDELLPLLLPEPLLEDFPASLPKPGLVAVLEQPLV